ncbi:hypothetical protein, partial [Moorena sp. SIO3I6]|uniref:hypothetical protein n=1 Tax=Moorena sp. SIO3I6 TaxID=2607831 RepID=UPI0025FB44C1
LPDDSQTNFTVNTPTSLFTTLAFLSLIDSLGELGVIGISCCRVGDQIATRIEIILNHGVVSPLDHLIQAVPP